MVLLLTIVTLTVLLVISTKLLFPHKFNYYLGGTETSEPSPSATEIVESNEILDSLPAGLFVIDQDYTITYINQTLVNHLETSRSEILNRSLSHTFEISEGLKQSLDATIDSPEREINRSEATYVSPDGNKKELELVFTRIDMDDELKFICLVPTFTNIVAARDHLRKTERLKAMGEMVSGLAHEINNPLTGVVGFANLLLEEGEDVANREELQIIHQNAQRCKDIIDNMLGFIRSGSPDSENIDVNQLIENSIKLTRRELDIHSIQITKDLDPELPQIMANRTQIEEVIINILTNAKDELKNIDSDNRMIRVKTKPKGDRAIEIEIDDNGPGIPEEKRNSIFEPFYTTKTTDSGTGLGLSIAQGIIDELGGQIQIADSELGGASFRISLPISDDSLKELEGQATGAGVDSRVPDHIDKILVVEDEKSVVQLFQKFCEQSSVKGEFFGNPLEAIEFLNTREEFDPDAVFLDLVFPGKLRGRDFYEWLENFRPDLLDRLVLMTGNPNDDQTEIARSSDTIQLLSKPLNIPDIGQALHEKGDRLTEEETPN
ncbi:MAG: ATP-binding protein [bacterium]